MSVVADSLAKKYPNGVWGTKNVSFEAKKGEITVLLGPNGAGKTTTIGMLTTLLKPTRGEALIDSHSTVSEPWKVRERIALCPQDIKVDANWTPWDAIKGYLLVRGQDKKNAESIGERYLKALNLWSVKNIPAIQLSGGQRKRIAVAMVLASGADVIFLDEPSSGLDVEARYVVWKSLRKEANKGKTIILTTHDMREAEMLGDRIIMISKGVSAISGTVEELKAKIPYSHKIVVKNVVKMNIDEHIDLGDRKIIYTKSREDAIELIKKIKAESVSVEEVNLEDVYLYTMGGPQNGKD